MNRDLNEFYRAWSEKEPWLIAYEGEAACRKVDTILQGMPELRDLDIKSAVDFGCGYGKALHDFYNKLKLEKAYGFDVSENGVDYARRNYASSELQYHKLSGFDNYQNAQFIKSVVGSGVDVVLLIDLLEHIPDCNSLMLSLSSITKYFIVLLPIEENMINNYFVRKIYPSTRHYNGHLREFNVNSVYYFIRKLGLTPIAEGIHIYAFKDSYPPQPPAPISLRGIARKSLKYIRMILSRVLPEKIYIRLVGPGAYYCIATFNKDHILNP
jgi:SAM-dependent methyltransferase